MNQYMYDGPVMEFDTCVANRWQGSTYAAWHLNRLLMLIRICNAENKPPKKRSKRDLYRHHAEVNSANRKKFNSKG